MQLVFKMGFPLFYLSFFIKLGAAQTVRPLYLHVFVRADRKLCFIVLNKM